METWQEHIENAKKHFKIADHMAYVTFTLLKENRIMIKILMELSEAISSLIKSFLYYEYSFKRINIYKDPKRNLKTFVESVAPRYIDKKCVVDMINIIEINKKHKQAPIEFVRRDKFVILLGEHYEILDVNRLKGFIGCVRKAIKSFPEQV